MSCRFLVGRLPHGFVFRLRTGHTCSTTLRASFTLIELLIVIAIIAVLATVVILALNPAQLLMQARDANRVSDMKTLNQALQLYEEDVGTGMGASSTLYISVPDPLATTSVGDACQGLGLSTSSLPAGWTYHCAGPSYYKNVDGTGWIPVDFKDASFGSPIGTLPVDPTNTTSSGLYYTYAVSGDPYELTALMESDKYASFMANDGGPDPAMYELGTDLTLSPFTHGMVGYWTFNNLTTGVGNTVPDSSGMGNNGTLEDATSTGTGPTYVTSGCVSGGCLSFDGVDDYVQVPSTSSLQIIGNLTINAFVYETSTCPVGAVARKDYYGEFELRFYDCALSFIQGGSGIVGYSGSPTIPPNHWTMVTATKDVSAKMAKLYINGSQVASVNYSANPAVTNSPLLIGAQFEGLSDLLSGLMDNVRIYNRALSASEIAAIYNAEK